MSKVTSMLKTETLKLDQRTERSINNGTSFTLMSGRENHKKENLMKNMDSMLKDHSTLFHNFKITNILI